MNSNNSEWQRLVAAARRAPADPAAQAPYGFATRVAAQAFERSTGPATNLLTRLSWGAIGMAALVMAITIATNLGPVMKGIEEDSAALADPVTTDIGDPMV